MGFRIVTNVQLLNTQRNLTISNDIDDLSMEKLLPGYLISKASDDTEGLSISKKLKADYLVMPRRNTNDRVSLIQTAECELNEIRNILNRLSELSTQGAEEAVSNTERGFLNKGYNQLKEGSNHISKTTEFNETLLLNDNQDDIDKEIKKHSNFPLEIQVGKNFFKTVDSRDNINATNIIRIDFSNINTSVNTDNLSLEISEKEEISSISTKKYLQKSINVIDKTITKISSYRSTMDAIQSHQSSNITQLSMGVENTAATNSRICDTDFAEETSKLAQINIILKQSRISVLPQSNQIPALALRLLR